MGSVFNELVPQHRCQVRLLLLLFLFLLYLLLFLLLLNIIIFINSNIKVPVCDSGLIPHYADAYMLGYANFTLPLEEDTWDQCHMFQGIKNT